jgi:hypothetical protein
MVRERTLDHQQEYQFKVHVAKLALTANTAPQGVSAKVERYLFSVFEDFPDHLFQQHGASDLGRAPLDTPSDSPTAMRSSKSCFETLPFARIAKQNLANDLAALGLLLARKQSRGAGEHPGEYSVSFALAVIALLRRSGRKLDRCLCSEDFAADLFGRSTAGAGGTVSIETGGAFGFWPTTRRMS